MSDQSLLNYKDSNASAREPKRSLNLRYFSKKYGGSTVEVTVSSNRELSKRSAFALTFTALRLSEFQPEKQPDKAGAQVLDDLESGAS